MKQMKFFLVALVAVVMSVSVTSCMKSDNESSFDIAVYATVVENFTSVSLAGDDGNIYYPQNSSALKTTGGDYPKRVFVYLKYGEGVTSASEKKTVTIVQAGGLYTRSLCMRPDTIQNDIPLSGLNQFGLVSAKYVASANVPAYCDVAFTIFLDASTAIVDLVPVTASGNELTVKLQQTVGNKSATYTASGYASFSIPSVGEINSALALAKSDDDESAAPTLQAIDGKIKIKITGVGRDGQTFTLPAKEVTIANY